MSKKERNGFPYIILVICLPLIGALFIFALPQYSPFPLAKLETIIIGYGVLLFGLFGGIRLNPDITSDPSNRTWITAIIVLPLVGLIILLLAFPLALTALTIGFGALGVWDTWSAFKGNLSKGYSSVRTAFTWLICSVFIAIFLLDGLKKIPV